MKRYMLMIALALVVALALPAAADTVDVYTVGASSGTTALDPAGNPVASSSTISWNHFSASGGTSTLSIIAEGIDNNGSGLQELDQVLFNGTLIGYLTDQGFYSPAFNLCIANSGTGPCGLNDANGAPIAALSTSVFTVNALAGINTVEVIVDPNNWVNQIDVSTLTTPEPSSLLLLGVGLAGLSGLVRRRLC